MNCRVLLSKNGTITNSFENHNGWSKGVDVVKTPSNLDYIVAHSDGQVIFAGQDNRVRGYGNFVMILHEDNLVTVYGHLAKVFVKSNEIVSQGKEIGYMGNTGNSYGAHLHFEVRRYSTSPLKLSYLHDITTYVWLNPTPYLDNDLPYKPKEKVIYRVQTNAFSNKDNAKREMQKLREVGFKPMAKLYADGLIHVQTNAYEDKANAEKECAKLEKLGFNHYITTENGKDIIL